MQCKLKVSAYVYIDDKMYNIKEVRGCISSG